MTTKTHIMVWPMTFLAPSRALTCCVLALVLTLSDQGGAYSRNIGLERSTERCSVVLAYVKFLLPTRGGESLIFSEASDHAALSIGGGNWRSLNDVPVASPPSYLLKAASFGGQYNALPRCTLVKKWMSYKKIKMAAAVPADILQPSNGNNGGAHQTAVIVNLPVINRRGDEAVIIASEISGPLAAGTSAIYLTRRAGSPWRVTAMKSLTVA